MNIKKYNVFKFLLSFTGIIYVWSLPLLSMINFCEKNSTTISQFISNPQSTGAMAAVSFLPIILINEYQDMHITNENKILNKSLLLFEISYGLFLSFPVCYTNIFIHELLVILFAISFIIHSLYIVKKIQINKITKIILLIGCISFIMLSFINSNHLIYWCFESICFTCMFLFTPIDWYIVLKKQKNNILY